jgi:hypothetical protein
VYPWVSQMGDARSPPLTARQPDWRPTVAPGRSTQPPKLHRDEDLVVQQNAALMNRAMSELSTGARELYKATAYIKTLKRS